MVLVEEIFSAIVLLIKNRHFTYDELISLISTVKQESKKKKKIGGKSYYRLKVCGLQWGLEAAFGQIPRGESL